MFSKPEIESIYKFDEDGITIENFYIQGRQNEKILFPLYKSPNVLKTILKNQDKILTMEEFST